MTQNELQGKTRKELAALARKQQIAGWHPMRKAELIKALRDAAKSSRRRARRPSARSRRRLPSINGGRRDRLVAKPVSARWLLACWEISARMLARAESSLGSAWHRAKPVLRLFELTGKDGVAAPERRLRDIGIDLTLGEYCVEVSKPGRTYRLQLGFATRAGEFFALSHCDPVTTNRVNQSTENGSGGEAAGDSTRRPVAVRNGLGAGSDEPFELPLEIQTDLLVHGQTEPEAVVEMEGKRIKVGRDGRFEIRLPLDNGRRFLPATARTADGACQRSVALSIERHLKLLESQATDEMVY